jgi:protein-S-isoprenylcysteine O-methyltransferase Ste14
MAKINRSTLSIGGIAIAVENVFFPLLFFYYSCKLMLSMYIRYPRTLEVLIRLRELRFTSSDISFISSIFTSGVLLIFNLSVCRGFLIRQNLHHLPKGLLNILIPLITTFSYLMFSISKSLPQQWNSILFPENLLLFLRIFGVFFALFGTFISTMATLNLKFSFGIFVQVRKIQTQGLYQQVRHPIYLGYIFTWLSLCLLEPKICNLLFASMTIPLTIFRAHLEEKELAAYSSEYREYIKNTPFMFPFRFVKQ